MSDRRSVTTSAANTEPKALFIHSIWDGPGRAGGGEIYAAGIVDGLIRSGWVVTPLGTIRNDEPNLPHTSGRFAPTKRTRRWRQLLSRWPAMASSLDTGAVRSLLRAELDKSWDLVILSHLSAIWALDLAEEARSEGKVGRLVYSSQNIEQDVWGLASRSSSLSHPRRILRLFDGVRVQYAEQRMTDTVDLATCITERDCVRMRELTQTQVLRLGPSRHFQEEVPARKPRRSVLIFGSLRWELKVANLTELLDSACRPWHQSGIEIVVAGAVEPAALAFLEERFSTVDFLGPVQDPRPHYETAGLAVIHEPLGGGFKMKTLDYLDAGIHIAATVGSAEGLSELGTTFATTFATLDALVEGVPALLDDKRQEDQPSLGRQQLRSEFSSKRAVEFLLTSEPTKDSGL